jgi:hypothetical protein
LDEVGAAAKSCKQYGNENDTALQRLPSDFAAIKPPKLYGRGPSHDQAYGRFTDRQNVNHNTSGRN